MNNIGQRIKDLRKQNDLTQEKLADFLGVTYQSVSKWETGITMPDLGMIVPLARLLHVSTDELLGMKSVETDTRREEIEATYKNTWQTGDLEERYRIAQAAVSEYPGDMKYLDWLAWITAMRSFGFADDETYIAEQEKAIKLFACVIENAADERIRASSIQGIVQYLSFRGRYEEAKKYAECYPENYSVSREEVLLSCLQGDEKVILSQKMLDRMLTDILNQIGEGTMEACVAQEQIIHALIPDENYLYYNCFLAENYLCRARIFAGKQKPEKAIEALKKARRYAVAYDNFMLNNTVYHFTSPFFDKVEHNTADICRSGTTTQEEDFIDALGRPAFDSLRDREDFKDLLR